MPQPLAAPLPRVTPLAPPEGRDAPSARGVSLVIPACNEAAAIAEVVGEARRALDSCVDDFEIIVVDDGSTDETGRAAASAGARVIRHPFNRGYGNALKTGILASRHESVVICDADGSYPLDQLPRLLEDHESYDMIVGARRGRHFHGSLLKSIGRRCQLALVNFVTGRAIPDANSGFRLLRRSQAVAYFDFLCTGFSFTTSITIAMICEQRLVRFVDVDYRRRRGTSHVRYFRDTLRSLQIIVHCILRYNPIKAFLLLAAMPFLAALGLAPLAAFQPVLALPAAVCGCTSLLILACGMLAYCVRSPTPGSAVDAGVYAWLDDSRLSARNAPAAGEQAQRQHRKQAA